MDTDTVKANEKQFFEHVNSKDTKSMERWIDDFVSEDFINHNPTFDVPNDREGLKEMFRILFEVFPEINFSIKEMVIEKNIMCFRHRVRGIKADKDIIGLAMVKFKNGRITDRWAIIEPI